jgi:hypothetical protein
MSLRATLWAYDDAPVENGTEVLVLIALADEASDDGRNAFPGIKKVAARARVKRRAAQYALRKLEKGVVGPDGTRIPIIRRGDQSVAAKVIKRKDRRPVVYDLCMNVSWEAVGKVRPGSEDDDEDTADDGVQDMHPAGETSASDNGVQNVHPAERGANSRTDGVQSHDERGAISRTDGVHAGAPDPSLDPTKDPTKDPTSNDDSLRSSSRGDVDKRDLNAGRDDVARVVEHLSKRLTERDVRHSITKAWRDAARLLIDTDGRSEAQVHNMIEWCQDSEFWRANIHSMPKLRERYDQMREQALRGHSGNVHPISTRHHSTNPDDRQAILNSFG